MTSNQHHLLIFLQVITIFNLINAVPIVLDANGVSVNNETLIPNPVSINGSLIVLDLAPSSKTTVPPTSTSTMESTTASINASRNVRSDGEPTITGLPSIRNESSSERSSIIHFPQEEDIDLIVNNSSSPKLSAVSEDATVSSEIAIESNSTINEGIIETSSSSSTTIDLSSPLTSSATPTTTSSPTSLILFSSTTTTLKPPMDQAASSSTPASVSSTDATRIERSQSDLIADEINANLTETLIALTTLSSILNQTSTNDLPATV